MRRIACAVVEQATEEHVRLINLAYRSPPNHLNSWTGEGHLVTGARIVSPDSLNKELRSSPDIRMLEARLDDRIIGSLKMHWLQEKHTVELGMINIDPALQGQGYGKQLIGHAEELSVQLWPETKAFELLVLKKRSELISFYQRLGYADTGERVPFPPSSASVGRPTEHALKEYDGQLEFAILRKELRN